MQKTCAACGGAFEISKEDLAFLEKVSPVFGGKIMQIPPPTRCPDCRQQRRLAWRNERKLYHRICDFSKKEIISAHSPDKKLVVYSPEVWNSDAWDPLSYGRDFDFSLPFFEQLHELRKIVPRLGLIALNNENSPYVNMSGYNKNCYLLFAAEYDEDCHYGTQVIKSRLCIDALNCYESERCYEVVDCEKCYELSFSQNCSNCNTSSFLFDCKGCSDCLFSANLRNKKFCFQNEQLSEEEFAKRKKEFLKQIETEGIAPIQREFEQFLQSQPHRAHFIVNCENVEGDYLQNSRNLHHCFDLSYGEDCAYVFTGFKIKDLMDVCHTTEAELGYEGTSYGYGAYRCLFTVGSWTSRNVHYCDTMHSSNDCFGCISLKHKNYCILNKQHSKKEYEELVPRIIEHMRSDGGGAPYQSPAGSGTGQGGAAMNPSAASGSWGQFFPIEMSPYDYNETLAQDYYPLTEKEVTKRGWHWRSKEEEPPKVQKIIPASALPSSISAVPDDILQWAIECEATARPFKLIKQELAFYREMKLPVPHFHPDERHRRRMERRNPRKLWSRQCANCQKPITTSFAPERKEQILCESCYEKVVY